ncbi:MAG: hypothetical protein AB7S26_32380 [Sandaracinaceae bacterium]
MADDKTKKILLGVGAGCLGLVALCCLSGLGLVLFRRSSVGGTATDHAERFLTHLQAQDYDGALEDIEYDSSYSLSTRTSENVRQCYGDTVLSDITSFHCDDYSADLVDGDADVECTVTSASRGEHEVTIHVNNADEVPYNGFTWFDAPGAFGAVWASDACTLYSGREYYQNPPSDRVRPAP